MRLGKDSCPNCTQPRNQTQKMSGLTPSNQTYFTSDSTLFCVVNTLFNKTYLSDIKMSDQTFFMSDSILEVLGLGDR